MKKLLTFSLAFMLAVLFNTNAAEAGWNTYVSVTPAEGEVEELSTITLTFEHGVFKGYSTTISGVTLKKPDGSSVSCSAFGQGYNGNNVNVFVEPACAEPGVYKLNIPAGAMQAGMNGPTNGEMNLQWTIVDAPKAFAFESAVPANGAKVNRLEEIVVNFAAQSALTGSATVNVAGQQATFAPTGTPGQVKATLPQAINAEGIYSIAIPEGAFTAADGTSNEAVTLNYTIEKPEMNADEIRVSPEDGVKLMDISTIAIEFPESISVNEAAGAITFSNGATVASPRSR